MLTCEKFNQFVSNYDAMMEENPSREDIAYWLFANIANIEEMMEIAEIYYDQHEN